jgi:hypothetical protein
MEETEKRKLETRPLHVLLYRQDLLVHANHPPTKPAQSLQRLRALCVVSWPVDLPLERRRVGVSTPLGQCNTRCIVPKRNRVEFPKGNITAQVPRTICCLDPCKTRHSMVHLHRSFTADLCIKFLRCQRTTRGVFRNISCPYRVTVRATESQEPLVPEDYMD